MAKYLGETGLAYLWGKIKTWVGNYTKITSSTGKDTITTGNNSIDIYDWAQGSTKPSYTQDEVGDGTTYKRFSATEQTKLSGIATGAEVNQNAFTTIKVTPVSGSSTNVVADTKTDTLELKAGDNITLTPDATNDKITISAAGGDPASATPLMDGTGTVGTSAKFAREDHVHPSDTNKISTSEKGAANGVCPLDSSSLIDAQYLPSYVDDVVEAYARAGQTALSSTWLATGSASGTVITPTQGKIYVLMAASGDYPENTEFRWGGSTYVKINDGGIAEMTTSEMDTATNNWT